MTDTRQEGTLASGFRFSSNIFGLRSADEFAAMCHRAENYGYDTIFAADHLGHASPFQAVVAAAAATDRLRVGTLVVNLDGSRRQPINL